jgi:hypothetical protein
MRVLRRNATVRSRSSEHSGGSDTKAIDAASQDSGDRDESDMYNEAGASAGLRELEGHTKSWTAQGVLERSSQEQTICRCRGEHTHYGTASNY